MHKKFVPLASNHSPSKCPYEVRTFIGDSIKRPQPEWNVANDCVYKRNCVLTLQDEIREIQLRTQENAFKRTCRRKCKYDDKYANMRAPEELHLKARSETNRRRHDVGNLYQDHKSLIEFDDSKFEVKNANDDETLTEPKDQDAILPELASPDCSTEFIYVPEKKVLALKRPKSGIFINESERPPLSPIDGIPYSTYNPRVLQEQFDAQNLKRIDLIPCKNSEDIWTWNVGLQKSQSELQRILAEGTVPNFECNNAMVQVCEIPKDVHKTFAAEIVFGTKAVLPQRMAKKATYFRRPTEVACLYVAFAESFRLNADFWTADTLDNVIKMAEHLIESCVKLNYKSPDNDYDIIPQVSARQAALNIKLQFAVAPKNESRLCQALSAYFSAHNAGILCSHTLYLMIWKRCRNVFYVYDPNGRTGTGMRDLEQGKSALLSLKFLEHLVHFIVNISQTGLDHEFKLYEIALSSYGKMLEPLPQVPFRKTFHKQWAVVNDSYAVIPGCSNGLFQATSSTEDNASMLISLMAILYSHMERGNSWKPEQIDELIRLGTAYHKSLRRKLKLKNSQHITIGEVPEKFVLGSFKASVKWTPFACAGTLSNCCQQFMDSLLTSAMQELFKSNCKAALLQIDDCVLGVWRDSELFYIYDPFRRGRAGQVLHPDDYRTLGTAILQMFANSECFLRMLYQKCLEVRRGGKFFIHAINVGCIKPIMDGKARKLRYPKLKLAPETYVPVSGQLGEDDSHVPASKSRYGGKKSAQLEACSIQSLSEAERQIVIRTCEIVEPVLDAVVCEIIGKFAETIHRPKIYQSATRVLFRSDKEYLEHLKYLIKREEDYDNIGVSFRTELEPGTTAISLEQELRLPSHFKYLPDGSWAVFGLQPLQPIDEEQVKLKSLLSSIICAALTAKYRVSTWTGQLIDYTLEAAHKLAETLPTYQRALGALLHNGIPKLLLSSRCYQLSAPKILRSHANTPLRQLLLEALVNFNRLMVICQRHSCLIVKRYNLLYMFCGFPVNAMAYWKAVPGPACMMRFVELDSLLNRIEYACHPQACDNTNYVVVALKVTDVNTDPSGRYRSWPQDLQQQMYNEALGEHARIEESKRSKMHFINSELAKENQRIKDFRREQNLLSRGKATANSSSEGTMRSKLEDEAFYENEEVEEECTVEAKHSPGFELETLKSEESVKFYPIICGYRRREKDLLYKIQGSKALQDRTSCFDDQIKPCLFASALAILSNILKPLNEWNAYRIDQIIEATLILGDKIQDMSKVPEIMLNNLSVGDYIFKILLRADEPHHLFRHLERQLARVLKAQKYIILQTSNCSYAISRDRYYHVFDAYPSMALRDSGEQELDTADQTLRRKLRASKKLYGERNTASWVRFDDIESLIKYLDQRACAKTWKESRDYTFMIVEILSYKKAPKSQFVLQLLTDVRCCNIPDEPELSKCVHDESLAWLEPCLPIWSRLHRKNADGRYRGMTVTKSKQYDIEIDHCLWSLWGNLHPQAAVFDSTTRGKQYLACCVLSLCATSLCRLIDWSPNFLDAIIINGDRYLKQSIQTIKCEDYQLALEDLDADCMLESTSFEVHIEMVAYGRLYVRPHYAHLNLARALEHFFKSHQFGVLQSFGRCLAIGLVPGHSGGYFMFDCKSRDRPLFPNGQGSAYILRSKHLQILLYCIVVTLNIPYHNVPFSLHKVDFRVKNGASDLRAATPANA